MVGGGDDAASETPTGTDAASLGLTELTDDSSRQQLFGEILQHDRQAGGSAATSAMEATEKFSLLGPFLFPNDTTYDAALQQPRTNSFFGVDISHYTASEFPIDQLKARNIRFLYMKATQGSGGLDGKFALFWKKAGGLPAGKQVHRGAYHFLSACRGSDCGVDPAAWGRQQADTFVKVVKANGLLATDMPPVVDLEWDKGGGSADRWAARSPTQILATVDAFLTEVNAKLQRRPMIYTARAWWDERMGATVMSATMKASPLWLADYSKKSRGSEIPRTIAGAKWTLWQFTDASKMANGFSQPFDSNIYKGKLENLYTALGVQEFPL